ncbi:hypothetical protein AB2N08_15500 [Massilia aurea]|uniref:hypothetical protein n=1 Tax=Massilia aurea TaxID=373040 RepID=UPI0034625792
MENSAMEGQSRRLLMLPLSLAVLVLGDLFFVILHLFPKLMRRVVEYLRTVDMAGGFAGIFQYVDIESLHQVTMYFSNPLFNIETDNGYAENYQHLKFAAIVLVLCYLCIKNAIWTLLPWALLFTYFLADDALRLHERLGFVIAERSTMTAPFGLRMQDVGELIVVAGAGLIILPSLLMAYYFAGPALRKIFHHLALILSLLIFFGVGVDMMHTVFRENQIISQMFGLIEDGGEMLAVSIFGWYAYSLTKRSLNLKQAASQPTYHLPHAVMAAVRH